MKKNDEMRRASEAPHVIAAKNLADVFVEYGGKRASFFENYAHKNGFSSWNAFRELGKIKLHLHAEAKTLTIDTGIKYSTKKAFMMASVEMISAAKKAGYTCDFTAPMIISDNVENFVTFGKLMNFSMRRRFSHRSFVHIDGLDGQEIGELIRDNVSGHEGLIILDVQGITKEQVEAISLKSPKSIVLSITQESFSDFADESGELIHSPDIYFPKRSIAYLEKGLWGDRARAMLNAFSASKQELDLAKKPSVEELDISCPAMKNFAMTIPGYQVYKTEKNTFQDMKAREQFGFLMMQI